MRKIDQLSGRIGSILNGNARGSCHVCTDVSVVHREELYSCNAITPAQKYFKIGPETRPSEQRLSYKLSFTCEVIHELHNMVN